MNKAHDHQPGGGETQQNKTTQQDSSTGEEKVQISQPNVERPEGPFEHSGETSGWTEAERKEKKEEE